jgi:HEAT repeat protein
MFGMHVLFLAVATLSQTPVPPVPPVLTVPRPAALRQAAAELAVASSQLTRVRSMVPGLANLAALRGVEALTAASDLHVTGIGAGRTSRAQRHLPPPSWDADDPADSLYRSARQLLNRARYAEAATAFADLVKRYPNSTYTADAYYWQAFSLYKTGETSKVKQARTVLEYQKGHFPHAATLGDADALYAQVQGALARQGDENANKWVREHAEGAGTTPVATTGGTCSNSDDDDDPRIAALNALLQMDAENAAPILKKVLARRDACSTVLRRKAVFIISQQRTTETEDILLSAARNDPDEEVREQAVFWLSQVGSERAVTAIDSILLNSTNTELQDKAVFALSQIDLPSAGRSLRDYAERANAPSEIREKAIFWLGQQHDGENAGYLRGLYLKLTDQDLKEKVIFSISQIGGGENLKWLMDVAQNEQEPIEMRKKALFWAGQSEDVPLDQLTALYDHMQNKEMKDQLIFVYSQRDDDAALEKLIDIAKHETDRELRKKAIFWIGQSHDPKAAQYLQEIINQ